MQGKQWTNALVPVGARVNFRLEMKAESGGKVIGFIAVDDTKYVDCEHG